MSNSLPIVVVGGGHAGVEASLSIARMGKKVLLVTQNIESIARASCNPAIGGLAKGHLVKEIDALGGEMGVAADVSGIQFKMLNKSKGRAVWSPRAQIDKILYSNSIKKSIRQQKYISVVEDEIVDFSVDNYRISSVLLKSGEKVHCSALIITTGTFLNGIVHIGNNSFPAGRFGERPSTGLSSTFDSFGFKIGRLKTGTPPRLLMDSVNLDLCKPALGDDTPVPFSFRTDKHFNPPQVMCHLVDTNQNVHSVINNSIHKSALFSGQIKGIGPRYCPSIEDKLVRFADRNSHQLFLEPEWLGSNQIYVNGFSTSLPEDVQLEALREIPALQSVELIRPGYAIEYDYFFPSQLRATLETKNIRGLFFAGQINGTSGYEEAAAQGLIAGINAVLLVQEREPFVLKRSEAYIGVLIDDLITKTIDEPYRMFTSRAEYRLSLRPDTATRRLSLFGHRFGLLSDKQMSSVGSFLNEVEKIKSFLSTTKLVVDEEKIRLDNYLLNPNNSIQSLLSVAPVLNEFSANSIFTAETDIKYKGYVDQERRRSEQLQNIEGVLIPEGFDFSLVKNLSNESREKLIKVCPETLGQASRIAGVTPSDIAMLSIMLKA
ncbi:MAG: tRNA uridine-5-carboxymethylaminomethyl(34) synthesis enzyme MnmG [Candidatus Marinimicrobia bacterium]|nr:tRNA uridine-5-carboxymethylaminomethyl(34) synthesis enzyme MnmG [Candidatus Neomarinimicrobiota bacterium]MBL7023317.1 tRNA uridine-5-carboxymethylaminomethyl(34) synthesis enzyme MnmG [Candidatus Neomarinimicrobiota bacterium]